MELKTLYPSIERAPTFLLILARLLMLFALCRLHRDGDCYLRAFAATPHSSVIYPLLALAC